MPETKLPSGQILKWATQEFPSVYANVMGFGMSPFDISLVFGELGEANPTSVTGIPRVKVLLSPEQAANLMKLLALAIESYTETHGQIRNAGAVDVEQLKAQMEAQKIPVQK
jgi:hypothetical protein